MAATKFADYAYSEEGQTLLSFGIEGESYTMVDGVPTYTDLITKHPREIHLRNAGAIHRGDRLSDGAEHGLLQSVHGAPSRRQPSISGRTATPPRTVPSLKFTDEELDTAITTFNEINSYNNEMINKFHYRPREL